MSSSTHPPTYLLQQHKATPSSLRPNFPRQPPTHPLTHPPTHPPTHLLQHKATPSSLRPNLPRQPLTTPPLRPRGTGEGEEELREPLQQLEEAVVSYMEKSRGAKVYARWEMEHVVPDLQQCLTNPDYYPIGR